MTYSGFKLVCLLCATLLLCVLASTTIAQESSNTSRQEAADARQRKLRAAAEVAEHFTRRFQETLDFAVPFKEMYITNPALRISNMYIITPNQKTEKTFGKDMVERLYMAFSNTMLLSEAYESTLETGKAVAPEIKAIENEMFAAQELLEQDKGESRAAYQEKLEKYLVSSKRFADVYRKHIPPGAFDSPTYKAYLKKTKENFEKDGSNEEVVSADKAFNDPDLAGKKIDVYLVRYGRYAYFLVEDQGSFKVVEVTID